MTRGHVRRLEAIYRGHARRVRWVLRARGIGEHDIEDLVHDVFLAIHRRLPAHDEEVALATWVCGVARSVAFAHRRGDARRRRVVEALAEPEAALLPDDELARKDAWHRLAAALDDLHVDQREAFVLIDVLGMRAAEAAQLVAAPVNTLYSRLRLARRHCEMRLRLSERGDAWMRAASEGECPSEAARERTWARIVALLPAVPIASATGASVMTWAIAGAMAIGAIAIAVSLSGAPAPKPIAMTTEGERERVLAKAAPTPLPQPSASSSRDVAPISPIVAAPSITEPQTRKPAALVPSPPPATPTDTLVQAVEVLRDGKAELARGNALAALRAVDTFRERFTDGPLLRDALRLERSAACAAADAHRAAAAHEALAKLQLADRSTAACS